MADYTVFIGGGTTLMIRDHGYVVEFWVRTGPSTYNYDQQWSFHANGADTPILKFRMLPGGNWQMFGSTTVAYDQDVRFTIYNAGLGFPTYNFWQHISRTTVPGPPYVWDTTAISSSHIRVQFDDGYDGGAAIDDRRIGYGTNPNGPEAYWDSDGYSEIGPLTSGQKYYFWAQTHNWVGWSEWSNRTEKAPWSIPQAPKPVTFDNVKQTSLVASFEDRGTGGTSIVERQLGYGLSPTAPTDFANHISGVNTITGLVAGDTYYFWARIRNSVGWGPWSERRQINLLAGARIKVGSQWVRAVPYIKVAGVWRVAQPWVRNAGVWKETSL